MKIEIPLVSIVAFFLAFIRANAFLWACPPFTTTMIPFQARIALAGGLAVAATPALSHDKLVTTLPGLIEALIVQIALGALMGFVVQLFVGAVEGAGSLIDQFSGMNLPPSIDPLSMDQTPLLAKLYEWLTTVLIFASGAYILIAQGFVRSFAVLGTQIPSRYIRQLPSFLASDIVSFFAAAAEIAAPLVAVIFVAQILLGLLAKSAPQANVFALGFPVQLLLVIFGLSLAVAAVPADVSNLVGKAVTQLFGGI